MPGILDELASVLPRDLQQAEPEWMQQVIAAILGAEAQRPILAGTQGAAQMSHRGMGSFQATEGGHSAIAESAEIQRQNELLLAFANATPNELLTAPPLGNLLRRPSVFDQVTARWTGPSEETNIYNSVVDLLGAQFAGGGLGAANAARLGKLGQFFDPRVPMSQVNITGYHGSPHRIRNVDEANPMGKFDLSKIGTGEGAQAYGHGIYITETPGVAKTYAAMRVDGTGNIISGNWSSQLNDVTFNGKPLDELVGTSLDRDVAQYVKLYRSALLDAGDKGKTWKQSLAAAKRAARTAQKNSTSFPYFQGKAREAEEFFFNNIDEMKFDGYLYEVDLPDEKIAQMLDWDKPLSEQPESVRSALQKAGLYDFGADLTGGDLIRGRSKDAATASAKLNELGIPGIRYLDGSSRRAGEGTSNFVVFNPDDVKILSRNGEKALPMDEASRMARAKEIKKVTAAR